MMTVTLYRLAVPDDFSGDTFYPRSSQVIGYTCYNGNALLGFCYQTKLRIMSGRVGNEKGKGNNTFIRYQNSSLVDCFRFRKYV